MFSGIGLGVVQVEGSVVNDDGTRPLTNEDFFVDAWARPGARKIDRGSRVAALLGQACKRLPGATLEARWRKALREGWSEWEDVRPVSCGGSR
jgi:hypothetical protein